MLNIKDRQANECIFINNKGIAQQSKKKALDVLHWEWH